jgi:protein-tyrosine phosphatase
MRQIAQRLLWIGNARDLCDVRSITEAEIAAVVELADSEPLASLPRDLIRYRFPLSDGGDNSEWLLRLAVRAVADLILHKTRSLIGCSAGMSRSISLAAAGIARAEGRALTDALKEVAASGPVDVAPRLLQQLQRTLD